MELADLGSAGRRLIGMRQLLHFFAIGAALFVAKATLPRVMPRERPTIEVLVPKGAQGVELAQRIEEAILVEEGLRFGWAESDPVVRRRLAVNMAFASGAPIPSSDAAIDEASVAEAFALGMHRSDPVVRGRLVSRVRQILDTPAPAELPDDATLAAHLESHRARFERPSRVELVHVMLARDRRGATLEADAAALLARLRSGVLRDEGAEAEGDPNPLLAHRQRASIAALDRLFGSGFGDAVARLEPGVWSGPIASSYGVHLVRVDAREDALLPALDSIRARVLADYLAVTRPARIARRLGELRERYTVRIVRGGGSS